jgi:hypothetical protein
MSHRWAALVLVLALCAMTPRNAAGQNSSTPRGHSAKGGLGQNFPNPLNPETTIPFSVGDVDANCVGDSQLYTVRLRILNVVAREVAVPVFAGAAATSTAAVSSTVNSQPIRNLRLPCGRYNAYWNGKEGGTNREAASGVYIYQLFINNRLVSSMKMTVIK